MKKIDEENLLRDIRLTLPSGDYRLRTWDTGRLHSRGTTMIGYELFAPGKSKPIFCGEDFSSSPMDCIDSDASVAGLLSFLSLKPGDTDAEYFEHYTEEQLEFADGDAEDLAMLVYHHEHLENGERRAEISYFEDWG